MNEIRKWLHSDVPEIRFSRGLVVGVAVSEILVVPLRLLPALQDLRASIPPGEAAPGDGLLVILIAVEAMLIGAFAGVLLTIVYFLVAPLIKRVLN